MRDEFASIRLPDLPNAGYSTRREKALTDEVMYFIRDAERDRMWLLTMVVDGKDKFRAIARKAWKHLAVDTDLCDAVYGYLTLLAGENPGLQLKAMQRLATETAIDRVWRMNALADRLRAKSS